MTIALHPLAEKAEIIRGVTFSKRDAFAEKRDGTLPVIRAGNIQDQLDLDDDLVFVPAKLVSERQRLRRGDIVMCTSSGSADIVGKTAYADNDWNGSFGAFCAVVRPKEDKCYPRYLFHYLRSPEFRNWTKNSSGVNIKNIRKSELDEIAVPFPNIHEQRRIAAILDKADAIRRKRQQALALADDFLKSVFLEMFGDPETNPKQLPQEELGELLERIDSGHSPKCEARPAAEDEIGILKVSSISSTHFKPEENKAVFEGYPIDERNLVHSGDLLFSRKNTYQLVGASAIVENVHGKLAMPDLIFRLVPRPDRKIEIPYLWMLLTQDSIRERLRKVAGGSAASMPNIGKERLRSVLLPIAKPEDQVQFTKYYSKRISLKKKLQENLTVTEDLFASLSQRAFRGEL